MTLQELNNLDKPQLAALLTKCNGSSRWVQKMIHLFPFTDEAALFNNASNTWFGCSKNDWLEAFRHHPKIGDINSLKEKFAATADWASGEQAAVNQTSPHVLEE